MAASICNHIKHIKLRNIPVLIIPAAHKSNNRPSKWRFTRHAKELAGLLPSRKFDCDGQSMSMRGYLRSQKPYTPPEDVDNRIYEICSNILNTNEPDIKFDNVKVKFSLLSKCGKELDHYVPDSLLHKITSVEELIVFYRTPVDVTFPLDMMKRMELPKNLHVLYQYTRFHPETDMLHRGKTAFPESSTIVPGLRNKKRYQGFDAKKPWS